MKKRLLVVFVCAVVGAFLFTTCVLTSNKTVPMQDAGVPDSTTLLETGATDCSDVSCSLPTTSTQVLSSENWRLSVPLGSDWVAKQPIDPGIKIVLLNEQKQCMVLFIKELTVDTFSQYAVSTVEILGSKSGGRLLSVSQVVINENRFVVSQFAKGDSVIWTWTTIKDGFGYAISCGGNLGADADSSASPTDDLRVMCLSIANSIEIK